jgi:hypothetical protein
LGIESLKHLTLTREELYELVWGEAMTKVAARFQISDVALKKRCVKNRIPVPGRGYWRQLETGKRPKRIALPKVVNAPAITFYIQDMIVEKEPISAVDPAFAEYEADHPIIVTGEQKRQEPETQAISRDLKGQKPDDYGAIRSRGSDTFQVRIHPSSKDRVLCLVDALARACRDRGFTFEEGKPGSRYWAHLAVLVDGVQLFPVFDERMRRTSYKMTEAELARKRQGHYVYTPTYAYEPTGELTLKIEGGHGSGQQTTWKDTRHQKIETRLNEVMIGFRVIADHRLMEQRKADDRKRRYDLIQRERAALRQRIDEEKRAVERLETDATAWVRAEQLRAYIEAVERQNADADNLSEKADWLAWAYQQADRLDPLRQSPRSILDTPEEDYRAFDLWQMRDE